MSNKSYGIGLSDVLGYMSIRLTLVEKSGFEVCSGNLVCGGDFRLSGECCQTFDS